MGTHGLAGVTAAGAGFGTSAASHLDGRIFFDDRNIRSYIEKIKVGASVSIESCQLSAAEQMRFVFLYGQRLEKYSTSLFSDRFGVAIEEVFASKLRHLQQRGLLTHTEGTIALTLPGVVALGAIEDYINDTSDAALKDPWSWSRRERRTPAPSAVLH